MGVIVPKFCIFGHFLFSDKKTIFRQYSAAPNLRNRGFVLWPFPVTTPLEVSRKHGGKYKHIARCLLQQ